MFQLHLMTVGETQKRTTLEERECEFLKVKEILNY